MGEEIKTFVAWLLGELHLNNWGVSVWIQDAPPAWASGADDTTMGYLDIDSGHYSARVWVSEARARAEGSDGLATAAHEILHLLLDQSGHAVEDHSDRTERAINVLAPFLVERYLRWTGVSQ